MPTSGSLFEDAPPPRGPSRLGLAVFDYKQASSILTPAAGFMAGYDFTLNPYSGCAFGGAYCYAAAFSRTEEAAANWGEWISVKKHAIDLIRRSRRPLRGKTIYISIATDPYPARPRPSWCNVEFIDAALLVIAVSPDTPPAITELTRSLRKDRLLWWTAPAREWLNHATIPPAPTTQVDRTSP